MSDKKEEGGLTRREFLKVSGIAGAALSLSGMAGAGWQRPQQFYRLGEFPRASPIL